MWSSLYIPKRKVKHSDALSTNSSARCPVWHCVHCQIFLTSLWHRYSRLHFTEVVTSSESFISLSMEQLEGGKPGFRLSSAPKALYIMRFQYCFFLLSMTLCYLESLIVCVQFSFPCGNYPDWCVIDLNTADMFFFSAPIESSSFCYEHTT